MSLVDQLNNKAATAETVLEIMHMSVSEVSDDKTEEEMLQEMRERAGDAEQLAKLQEQFQNDPTLIREAALAWISTAGEDPTKRPAVEAAIEDADRSAPLLEVAAITVISMYAMYLIAGGGISRRSRKIEVKPDGTFRQTEEIVYASFSEALKAAAGLFKLGAGAADPKDSDHE